MASQDASRQRGGAAYKDGISRDNIRDLSASKQDMANKIKEYEQNVFPSANTSVQSSTDPIRRKKPLLTKLLRPKSSAPGQSSGPVKREETVSIGVVEHHTNKKAWENEIVEWEKQKAEWEKEKADLQRSLEEEKHKTKTTETVWANEMKGLKEKNERVCERLRERMKELEQSLSKEKEDNKMLQNKINQLEQEMERNFNQSKTEWEKKYKKLTKKHTKEIEQVHKTINSLTLEKDHLRKSLEEEKHKTMTTDTYWTYQVKEIREKTEREINQSKTESEKRCKKLTKKHTKEKDQLHKTLTSLTVEKENLLKRFSTIEGDTRTHGNVNIANLSDAESRTKLDEVYSELYDNAWTEAFEELTTHDKNTEKDAIMILLKILMSSFQNCRKVTWGRYERLIHVASSLDIMQGSSVSSAKIVATEKVQMENPRSKAASKDECSIEKRKHLKCTINMNIDLMHAIKGIWRTTTLELKGIAAEPLYSVIETSLDMHVSVMPKTSQYLKRCIDLCWEMGVQEKPLHLDGFAEMDAYAGKKFDTDKFRAYTHSGSHVAFVVWPTLYLFEGGPILVKCIAQGYSPVKTEN